MNIGKHQWLVTVMLFLSLGLYAQHVDSLKSEGFEVFQMEDGDTTYLMKKYFMVLLLEGPHRDQGEEEAAKIQEAHLKHMSDLAAVDKINIAGPFDDDSSISGMVIYSVPTLEEATRLANQDPAVKAGRLKVKVHPFWAAVGSTLK